MKLPEAVQQYYDGLNSGSIDGGLFAEKFHFRGVMDEYDNAEQFLEEMVGSMSKMKPKAHIDQVVVSGDGSEVAVRAELETVVTELGRMRFSEWFRLEGGKISEIQLFFDPTPWREYMAKQEAAV